MLLISLGNRDDLFLYFFFNLFFDFLDLFLLESVVLPISFDLVLYHSNVLVGSIDILKHALLLDRDRLLQTMEKMLIFLFCLGFLTSFFLKLRGLVLKDVV